MLVVDLVLILAVAWLLGGVFERLGQPRVVGEVLAGLVLGVSVLGDTSRDLFPADARGHLATIGLVALVPYLFRVTGSLDRRALLGERRQIVRVATVAFAVPWLIGLGVGLAIHPRADFGIFLATAFAVTALPVLARIVEQHGLTDRAEGRIALGAAALEELLIWPLLAVSLALAGTGGRSAGAVLGLGALAVAAIIVFARVVAGPGGGSVALVGLALAAVATDRAGLHPVLGAVTYAWALPAAPRAAALRLLDRRAPRVALAVLLPLYFAVPTLGVDVSALGWDGAALTLAFVAVACIKLPAAALAVDLPRREALTVGALMNARGLVALVVLAIGRDAGLLDDRLYAAMVGMAILTTLATGPIIRSLTSSRADPAGPSARSPAWSGASGRPEPLRHRP